MQIILYEVYVDEYDEHTIGIFSTIENAKEQVKRIESSNIDSYKIRERVLDEFDNY